MDRWNGRGGKSQSRERKKKEESEERGDAGARKGRKVSAHCVFSTLCGPGGSKSTPAKAAGAEPSREMHAVVANVVCFAHFDFEMCFAPQRRVLNEYLNVQKCSGHGVVYPFWLLNVLRATVAYTCWILNFQKCSDTGHFNIFIYFQMCFAPKLRALFRHQHCQNCSRRDVLLMPWLPNVLRGPLLDVEAAYLVAHAMGSPPLHKLS